MKTLKIKTSVFLASCIAITASVAARAAEFTAEPSSTEISVHENLSIVFKTVAEDYNADIGQPSYSAPDFDEVNSYQGMTGIESSFINGKISVRKTQGVTVVLHPKKKGKLTIRDMKVTIDGKVLTAPNIVIDVGDQPSSNSGNSNSYSYGSGSRNSGLPQQGLKPSKNQRSFFIKTETNKRKVYKGEQIILTYALYTQVPILGVQVERYPTVPGFLKEDLDIPLVQNRLQFSRSIVSGREYNRAILAQYAIFPIKEGSLSIDALTGKFTYRTRTSQQAFDDDDAFGMLNQFLNSMQTSSTSSTSDPVSIEVLPLPTAGQPKEFSGLVGDFDITTAVDKYSLKAGEPLNVKVKIEGEGHAGSLEQLKVDWPGDFELYEDKSSTQFSRTGHSERLFDYMLIPRVKGSYTIPSISLAMFNPKSGRYEIKHSEPISINVLEGDSGSSRPSASASAAPESAKTPVSDAPKELRGWIDGNATSSSVTKKIFVVLALVSVVFVIAFLAMYIRKSRKKVERHVLGMNDVQDQLRELMRLDQSPTSVLAKVEALLGEVVFQKYKVSKGSLTRVELKEVLIENKVSSEIANEIESLIERCENFRFVPGGAQPQVARSVVESAGQLLSKILK